MKATNIIERMKENGNLVPTMVGAIGVLSLLTFIIALVLLFTLYGCTNNADGPDLTNARTPLAASASLPATAGSGTLTRAAHSRAFTDGSLSTLTLYYPATKLDANATPTGALGTYCVDRTAITQSDGNNTGGSSTGNANDFSFNTTAGTFGSSSGTTVPLYWQQIAGKGLTVQTFYLTVTQEETAGGIFGTSSTGTNADGSILIDDRRINTADLDLGNVLWASATTAAVADLNSDRPALAFGTMKSRLSRLTLVLNCKDCGLKPSLLEAFVYTLPRAEESAANATSADAQTGGTGICRQAWPTSGALSKNTLISKATAPSSSETAIAKFGATRLIAPQALPAAGGSNPADARQLVIRYNVKTATDGTPEADTNGKLVPTVSSEPACEWKLDLGTVSVKRTADSDFASAPSSGSGSDGSSGPGFAYGAAFGYNPGEHITLTLTLSLLGLAPGNVQGQITDYEADTDFGNIDVPVEPAAGR